ncbi:hypothetical protein GCM10010472_07530 [Pseudonocardia halophobica]|uniref:DUF2795 domain-containing protein n=1 Tax=Pseudonocardia halophobica TaxID=29401 RepID=A0A9W6L9F1_9PSEU|nr:DUF2795 domain-containing protein [Pseudonocardia halophobica]GLL14240.1 hypothetical protein GCM10017577_53870 [Pseudonocardia halophobica]
MYRRTSRADLARIGQVLAGLTYPAAKWQIIAHADHYGADSVTTAQLWSLPIGTYPDLAAVGVALGLLPDPRPGYRQQPRVQAAAVDQPRGTVDV